jgi:hypothetical protein
MGGVREGEREGKESAVRERGKRGGGTGRG